MNALGLTPEEFRHIVRCCERVLLNESTAAADLKRFLVMRLGEGSPDTAAQIARFDEGQMGHLRGEVLAAMRSHVGSALWA
jgi:hypothetical protein